MHKMNEGRWQIDLKRSGRVWEWNAFLWQDSRIVTNSSNLVPRMSEESARRAANRYIARVERRGGAERKTVRYEP